MGSRALDRFAPEGPPAGWRELSIGEALAEVDEPIQMQDDTEYDLVSVRRRFGGMFHRERLSGRQILTKSLRRVVPGTFVIARMQIVHGACTFATPEFAGSAISKSYSSFGSTADCDARYFSLLAEQPFMSEYFRDASQGVVIEKMTFQQDRWLEFPVFLPPLEEQRRIAEILDTVDETIQATERVIAKLECARSGLAHSLFGLVKAPSARLRDVASITSGSTPARSRNDYWKGAIPWVKTGEVRGNLVCSTEELITDRALAECPLEVYPVGTVLVAMYGQGATRGRVAMLGVPATTNQACAAIRSAPAVLDESYLFEFLKYSYDALRSLSHGSHQENLSTRLVGDFELPVPPLPEQTQVVGILDSASARLEAEKADLEKLRQARAGLADDLLSGRVRTVAA